MLMLVIVYARRYPDQPFCPWLLGTEFVEHFFGLARMMLPNFTYAEFLKMVQHVMVRQKILLSGSFKEKRERDHRVGYVLDFDASPLTAEDRKLAAVQMSDAAMDKLVKLAFTEAALICDDLLGIPAPTPTPQKPLRLTALGAPGPKAKKSKGVETDSDSDSDGISDEDDLDHEEPSVSAPHTGSDEQRNIALATHDAARYSALCDDYDNAVKELESITPSPPVVLGPPPPPPSTSAIHDLIPTRSEFIDESGKLSIAMMLEARRHWQSGTTTRSEKVTKIDSKFALARIARANASGGKDDREPEKMTLQEAANLTRVLQDQNRTIQESRPKKSRELRWQGIANTVQRYVDATVIPNILAKNVHQLNPLAIGSMVVVCNGERFYIGEIRDVFKKGANSRHGSCPGATSVSGLSYLSLRVYLPLTNGPAGDDSDSDDEEESRNVAAPLFSCHHKGLPIRLHTHAKAEHILFNLGPGHDVFETAQPDVQHRRLKAQAALCWISLAESGKVATEVKKITLKIPRQSGGR
ncbi:hypothetical protein C8R46DRAFT_1305602 [Mycena filopes]|nr:hypothetical protein C8R46DRAFT_1305602 [Mycena filopes]